MQAARWWFGLSSPARRRDDPVPVGVGVVGERDVEAVGHVAQPRHRVRRRAVHPDLAVPVERDEAERRVDLVVDDLEVEPVAVADRLPVGEARAAERVDAEPQAGAADRVEVDHRRRGRRRRRRRSRGRRGARRRARARTSSSPPSSSALASRSIQPVTSVSAGPPCGGLYLKPPSPGGLCDGRDDDPVGRRRRAAAAVVREDRVRDHRRRRHAVAGVDDDVDAVRREHLDDRAGRRASRARACRGRGRAARRSPARRGSGTPPR